MGESTWEEINDGLAGANYGWPTTEGATTNPNFKSPRYAYNHSTGACAITGGAFYSPLAGQFPSDYVNDYFFGDYCGGWIRKLDLAAGSVTTFATGIAAPVDLKVADDGSLYYLARDDQAVYQVRYGAAGPTITSHPTSQTVAPGASVTFSVRASGSPPLRYQWRRNGVTIPGATAPDYTIASVVAADNGMRFRANVSNDIDTVGVLSNEATLTVNSNQAPTGTISQPAAGTLYSGGTVINYAGTATDPEDGTLPASAFTWQVDFHHDTHVHPFIPATTGAQSGSFTIPTIGETSANVWYRIYLTVRDSGGLTHTTQRDISPRKVVLTLADQSRGAPVEPGRPAGRHTVLGRRRCRDCAHDRGGDAAVVRPDDLPFVSWSDGGAASHSISTPATNTTYTATYQGSTSTTGSPIALVQHAGKDAGTTASTTLAFPSGNTAGNWIAVAVRAGGTNQVVTVTDTRGNLYRKAIEFDVTLDDVTLVVFYAENISGGANTVQVSDSQSGTLRVAILEYAGVATTNSLDVTATSQGTNAAPATGNVATTVNGDLLIGVIMTADPASVTAGTGFTLRDAVPANPSAKLAVEDRVQPAAGTAAATASLGATTNWGAVFAAFKPGTASSGVPGSPGSPSPSNGATGVSTTPSLSWTAAGATAYDVSFGTSNPPGAAASNLTTATYAPPALASGTQYFWQIVARNSAGTTSGPVWSFTTAAVLPGLPGSPSPSNGATGVSTTPSLSWTAAGATTYDVGFGTSNPPGPAASNLTTATYAPPALASGTQYFWQIVARNSAGTTSGPVWSFTTAAVLPGLPGSPNPSNGATGVSTTPSLSWTAAGATAYDVSFGTSNPPGAAASNLTTATYAPPALASGTQYFWQIVARTSAGTTPGPVWSFTTAAAPPSSPIALVQHAGKDAGTTASTTLAFPSANTAGNWIAVAVRAGGTNQVVTVTDTRGNLYRKAVQFNVTLDDITLAIFYAENISGGSNTIQVSDSQSGILRLAILEYTGVATTNSLDVTAAAQGTSTAPTTGNVATTANGDLLIGVIMTADPASVTAGTGFTLRDAVPANPSAKLAVEDRVQPAAGSTAGTASLGATTSWGAVFAAFRARP